MSDSPVTRSATAAPGSPHSGPPENGALLILAADDRSGLERDLYGLTAPPTPAQAARISADKLLVYQALLDAAAELPADVLDDMLVGGQYGASVAGLSADIQAGMLVDEQYGAGVAELASRSAGAISLGMPLEVRGQEWFHLAYGDDWQQHAAFFAAEYAKVRVRDNPGLDPALREQQARRLAQASAWAAGAHRSLIVELLVPAAGAGNNATAGRTDRYNELRPGLTLKVMEYLQDRGVAPAIWEVEGFDRHDDAVAVAAMAARGGRQAHCVVLGRHAPADELYRWFRVAAPVPGWIGFAIGRSIWWNALHAHLHHLCTAGQARHRIRNNYLNYARYYINAREGILTAEHDVELQ
jgi:5-dehydro-2-deoxygluconokinase